jgi:predicted MPP superfamily phosphohydrolase
MRFIAVVLAVTVVVNAYLWHRLVHATTRRFGRGWWLGTATIALLAGAMAAALIVRGEYLITALTGYVWLAVMFYLTLVLLALEVPRVAVRWWWSRQPAPAPSPPADEGRRLLLARSIAITAGLVAVGTTGYGAVSAYAAPQVSRTIIPLRRVGRGLDGLRVALISDVHLGPLLGRAHTERLVRVINGLDADLIAITGDLADGSVTDLGRAAEPLRDLRSRHGTFFVTGNHEYYTGDLDNWLGALRGWGVRPLLNEHVEIVHGAGALDLAGITDPTGDAFGAPPGVATATDGRDPSRPTILLAHQPVMVYDARDNGVDLQLSGHTHGGQMCPFDRVVALDQPVVAGRGTFGETELFVTRGAGFWGPPVRVAAPPEISLIELRAR